MMYTLYIGILYTQHFPLIYQHLYDFVCVGTEISNQFVQLSRFLIVTYMYVM